MPYRRTNLAERLWTGGLFISTLALLAGTFALAVTGLPGWLLALLLVGWGLGVLLSARLHKRVLRNQRLAIRDALEAEGFTVDLAPTPERREIIFKPVSHLAQHLGLPEGSRSVKWFALGPPAQLIFEFEWDRSPRKSYATEPRTIIVFQQGDPALKRTVLGGMGWASMHRPRFSEESFMRRRPYRITPDDPQSDRDLDPRFHERWLAFGHADTLRAFLDQSTLMHLADSPKGEAWVVGSGWVCCACAGRLNAAQLMIMYRRMKDVLR